MSIRLIALDLDGTLLTSDKKLSEGNRRALAAAAAAGIQIVPCTGRSVTGLAPEVRDLPFVHYAITMNGASVADLDNGKEIHHAGFTAEETRLVWDYVKKYDTLRDMHVGNFDYIEPYYYEHIPDYAWDAVRVELMQKLRTPRENLLQEVASGLHAANKVNLYFSPARVSEREGARAEIGEAFSFVSVTSSLPNNLEINHKDATKGNGLRMLAKYLGLSVSETMACGDSFNDLTMLREAGLGVAMANSDAPVFAAADVVTLSNDQDGVAHAIYTWALGEN